MGVEPFLIASTLRAVLAQRLVRRLCPDCRTPLAGTALGQQGLPAAVASGGTYRAVGCAACKRTGFRGRTGIYELLVVDDPLRRLIHDGAAESAMHAHAAAQGMTTLREDGLRWVASGETTYDEVLRVTRAGPEDAAQG